jgi:hypothetical protein
VNHLLPCLTLLACCAVPATAGGNINLNLGPREFSDSFWDVVDDQSGSGFTVDFGRENWPVNVAVSWQVSDGEGFESTFPQETEAEVEEFSAGFVWSRKAARSRSKLLRPFVGAGVSHVSAELVSLGTVDDDDAIGLYVVGGLLWQLGWLNLGIETRILTGTDIRLFDTKTDADYYQVGLVVGYGW